VGLLHGGKILFSENLEDMKFHMQKVQCVIPDKEKETELVKNLDVIRETHQGSLMTLLVRGTNVDVLETVAEKDPVFAEALPLTLEEIFISETSLAGYEVGRLFGDEA